MRLLITTQAVDLDDPVLAFFHGWIAEFAKQIDHVEVICLKEGRHDLPANVSVHSLGKEKGSSRLMRLIRLYWYAWRLRKQYDGVFVHMNPEYLVLLGSFWQITNKKMALWYIHPKSSWWLKHAMKYPDRILSASEESFPIKSQKLVSVGIGVDTDFFSPGRREPSSTLRIMCAARIAPVKKVECMIDALAILSKRHSLATFDYYGEELSRDAEYADAMRKRADPLTGWMFRGKTSRERMLEAYRSHDVHVNATDSGSFDKAVFESMACGTITVASNKALHGILPQELVFEEGNAESLARVLEGVSRMLEEDRRALETHLRDLAVHRFSLQALVSRIVDTYL